MNFMALKRRLLTAGGYWKASGFHVPSCFSAS
jgi:hypothetical protein